LLAPQHFRLEIRFANLDDRSIVWIRFHFLACISDSPTGRFALFVGKARGRGRKDWTSGPNELTPSEPARRIFRSRAKSSGSVASDGCPTSCRVAGFKLVFDLRTVGSNFASPNSTIGILF